MPIQYNTPSWLHGADPLEAAIHGSSLGQRIAESNQRAAAEYMALQQRQQQFQQTMQMHQQQLEQAQADTQQNFQAQQETQKQNRLQRQQQLAVENAYKQSQLGLAKQKLELTTQAAAKKFQTQQVIQGEINKDANSLMAEEGMAADEARQKATVRAYMRHATDLGLNPAALGQLSKSATDQNNGGEWRKAPSGQDYYYEEKSGVIRFPPKPVPTPQWDEDNLKAKDLTKDIQATTKELKAAQADKTKTREDIIAIQQRLVDAQSQRHKIFQKRSASTAPVDATAPVTGAPGAAQPAPGAPVAAPAASPQAAAAMPQPLPLTGLKKEELQDGAPYITSKGVAVWDKKNEKFSPASSLAAPEPAPIQDEQSSD